MAEIGAIQTQILAAALESLEDGVVLMDADSRVLLWNAAATAIAGYISADVLSRTLPADLYHTDIRGHARQFPAGEAESGLPFEVRPLLVHLHHKQGHLLPVMLRQVALRDDLGKRFGTLLRFHPVEEVDILPHGANDAEDALANHIEHSQADLEDRLEDSCHEWDTSGVPFGLLWIAVDQAAALRKTHGRDAAEAMLAIVERTLVHALRPAEIMGRWGSNEFLVVCHERSAELLVAHAERVSGLARTADFRWWGDRVSLTVSIGAAQAAEAEKLSRLLKRAQQARQQSEQRGGNGVTVSAAENRRDKGSQEIPGSGGQECSQS